MGKRLYGRCFVIADVENRVKLGNLQHVVNLIVQMEEPQFALLLTDGGKGGDELSWQLLRRLQCRFVRKISHCLAARKSGVTEPLIRAGLVFVARLK